MSYVQLILKDFTLFNDLVIISYGDNAKLKKNWKAYADDNTRDAQVDITESFHTNYCKSSTWTFKPAARRYS